MRARTDFLATSFCAILVLVLPLAASAQRVTLDQVDSLANAGQVEEARSALEQWKKNNPSDARATFLSGRLALRAQDAEDAYLSVALSHPTSPYAPESLLRLGQARLTAGDAKQASYYLRRVISDYPRSEHRAAAQQWLQRIGSGDVPAPKAPVSNPVTAPPNDTRPSIPVTPPPNATRPTLPVDQPQPNARRIAIQVAAFREMSGARSVAAQLRRAGIGDVRLATVPDNALIRVRVGTFESSAAAAATVAKIRAQGLSAVIVSDVQRESLVRE